MSRNLVVITFDTEDKAEQVVDTLKDLQHQSLISLEDTAIVVKDESGKVKIKDAIDKTVKEGTAIGGLLGLFLGFLFFSPIGIMLVGALGGALVGKFADMGVEKKFVKEVSESLQPGTSALFFVIRSANTAAALAALRPYEGKVLQTTLPSDIEEDLKRALNDTE